MWILTRCIEWSRSRVSVSRVWCLWISRHLLLVMRFKFNYRSLLWTLLADGLLVFSLKVFSWLYWWWFHYLSLYCLFPTLGLGLQAEGLGLHCHLEASLVACEEPIYYLKCIWSWQYLWLLQSLSFKFLSKKREVLYRWYSDANTPYGVLEFVAKGQPGTEKKSYLATKASQKPGTAMGLSQPATKPATKQGASTAPTGPNRGERRCLNQSHAGLASIHICPFLFSH